MARTSSSRTAAASRGRGASWRLSRTALWRIWAVFGWTVSLAGAAWGLNALAEHVRAPRPDRVCRLEWVHANASAPDNWSDIVEEASCAADLRPDDDLHHRDLCAHVAHGLARSPWVAEVRRVTKRADGVVLVQADFRKPSAYVDVKGRAYLVDATGVRLPRERNTDMIPTGSWLESPVITGVSRPIPGVGEAWGGDDLAAGLSLVGTLQEEYRVSGLPFAGFLRAIDVSNYGQRPIPYDGQIRVLTVNPRCFIRWGTAPGMEAGTETTAERKVDMLRAFYAARGQFPDEPLDVRFEEGICIGTPQGQTPGREPAPSRR